MVSESQVCFFGWCGRMRELDLNVCLVLLTFPGEEGCDRGSCFLVYFVLSGKYFSSKW